MEAALLGDIEYFQVGGGEQALGVTDALLREVFQHGHSAGSTEEAHGVFGMQANRPGNMLNVNLLLIVRCHKVDHVLKVAGLAGLQNCRFGGGGGMFDGVVDLQREPQQTGLRLQKNDALSVGCSHTHQLNPIPNQIHIWECR